MASLKSADPNEVHLSEEQMQAEIAVREARISGMRAKFPPDDIKRTLEQLQLPGHLKENSDARRTHD
jgi:hypothetical protein